MFHAIEGKKGTCQYCKTEMTAKSSSGTKHLWQHLGQCTSFKSREKQMLLQLTSTLAAPSNWVFSQQKSCKILTKLIIADEKPFKSVDHPLFKAFVASLQPKFKAYGVRTPLGTVAVPRGGNSR
jgi:hypothetical protein